MRDMENLMLLTGLVLMIAAGISLMLLDNRYEDNCYCGSIGNKLIIKDIK